MDKIILYDDETYIDRFDIENEFSCSELNFVVMRGDYNSLKTIKRIIDESQHRILIASVSY